MMEAYNVEEVQGEVNYALNGLYFGCLLDIQGEVS